MHEDMMKQKKSFTEEELALIFFDLLNVVLHYQAINIIHRDIKLDNMCFGKDNKIKLLDFGLAYQLKYKEEKVKKLAGTAYYMAPEVFDHNYGPECDIWSLGL